MKERCHGKTAALLLGAMFLGAPHGWCADLSLQDAIDMALSQNTGLRITQKDEIASQAALDEAKGQNGISVSASDSLSGSKKNGQEQSSSNSLSVSGSLPLYTGGANEANIKKSDLGLQASKLTTERERENLKLDVIKAYYDALEARRTVDVRQETVDKYQDHYTNVSQLYAAGSKARIDVIRSSVELSNAQQDLIKAQNAYEVDLASLRNYINMDRNEPLTLTSDFSYDRFDIDMDSCIDYAYRNRKDLLIDQYKYDQQDQAVKAAKAGYLPTLKANLGLSGDNSFQPSSDSSRGVSGGLTLSWNIFDSGVTRAQVTAAENQRDIAKLTLDKDKEDIDLSVRQAYYNMREAEKRFNSTGDAVKQAEEDYFIAREKYRAGEGLMLDIIDAQEALSTARLNYISAEYDYARFKATVENAMGISLNDSEQAAAARMDKYAPVDTPAAAAAQAVLQEPVEPKGARTDTDTKGLAKKAENEVKAAASTASAEEVASELAEGNVSQ